MDQMFKAIVGIVLRASVKTKIKPRAEGVAQHARGFQFNLRTEKKKILFSKFDLKKCIFSPCCDA